MAYARSIRLLLLAVVASAALGTAPVPAQATAPGKNGLVVFNRGGDLYTATAAGKGIRRITSGGGLSGARWAPDGKRIAYKDKAGVVYVRTLATGKVVTVGVGAQTAPVWLPNGTEVAWSVPNPDGDDYATNPSVVLAASAAGSAALRFLTKIPDPGYPYEGSSTLQGISPDGHRIFVKRCGGRWGWGCWFFEQDVESRALSSDPYLALAFCDEETDPMPCTARLGTAAYSPEGDAIVFSGLGNGLPGSNGSQSQDRVYAMDLDGANLHRVSRRASGYNPAWSPNGRFILFTQKSGKTKNIVKVRAGSPGTTPTVLIKNASQADWQPVP